MTHEMTRARPSLSRILLGFAVVTSAFSAQAATQLYEISDLRFQGPSGQNGWPLPVDVLEPGVVGHFVWTYTTGDFQAGTGTLLDLVLPMTPLTLSDVAVNADLSGLNGAGTGNLHDMTYDFAILFQEALTRPNQVTAVSPTSIFDFTGSYLGQSGEWMGNITAGTISPLAAPVPEPNSALSLLGGGLAVLAWLRYRRTPARDKAGNSSDRL